jgi:hypothetical protein
MPAGLADRSCADYELTTQETRWRGCKWWVYQDSNLKGRSIRFTVGPGYQLPDYKPKLERDAGLEPATLGLEIPCSTY